MMYRCFLALLVILSMSVAVAAEDAVPGSALPHPPPPPQPPQRRAATQPRPGAPAAQQGEQQNPCERGSTQMAIAGMDMDVQRCTEAIVGALVDDLSKEIGQQKMIQANIAGQLKITQSDLDRARTQAAAQAEQITTLTGQLDWFKAYYAAHEPPPEAPKP